MKTKNLTVEERQLLVYYLAGYQDDTFYKFYHYAMDMFLKDRGFPPPQREKIKNINLFKKWFNEQFEKRDEYIINDMLVLDTDNCGFRFYDFDTDCNYRFESIFQLKVYYEFLHLDFSRYDIMPFVFDFSHSEIIKKPQQRGSFFNYQDAFYKEKHEFFFHYS